jgi:membrane protease YdiL (CAAX protease family)
VEGPMRASGGVRATVRRYRLIGFGSLVVLLTLGVAAAGLDRDTAPFALVFVPAIAALVVAAIADGTAGVGRLFRRIATWRVSPRWYLAAIGIPVVMWLGIDAAAIATGTPADGMFHDLGELPLVALVVLLPAVLEEFGWRGYALPSSPRGWSVVMAALVVGVLFIVPHLALYLPGGLYDNLPLWPLPLILLSYAVLLAWAYVGSGGSALIAALMHAGFNGFTPLSRGIDPVQEWQLHGIVVTVLAIVVIALAPGLRRSLAARAADPGAHPQLLEPEA